MNTLTLYQIAEQYREAAEAMADLDLPEEAVRDTLEGLAGELEAKAANVAMFVRNLETNADAIAEAARAMTERAKKIQNRAARIREYLQFHMERTGITSISCPYFTLKIRTNPPAVHVESENDIPADYWRPQPPKLDKASIARDLKAGANIPGADLTQGQRLEIKS